MTQADKYSDRLEGKLRLMQVFYGDGKCRPPGCDQCEKKSQSHYLYADQNNRAIALCMECREPLIQAGRIDPDQTAHWDRKHA